MSPSSTRKDECELDTNVQEIWTARIVVYQASGQTMKARCAEHDLTVHQLKYWLYKAQRCRVTRTFPILTRT
ncbi:IS66 family insertion sequence element accessory protein TnpA [Paenibacillus phytorum]|uniref:IS66 family insertion sequence element accessory protein TnpA n=1 Tax=Paenibacillus phytorum TaxID=2654977 RepID=UPI00406B9F32